jgi:hypothetical protein
MNSMKSNSSDGFSITLMDLKRNLVVVENVKKGIRYEFPNEFKQIAHAEIHDNYLLMIESKDGRRKLIQLLE